MGNKGIGGIRDKRSRIRTLLFGFFFNFFFHYESEEVEEEVG